MFSSRVATKDLSFRREFSVVLPTEAAKWDELAPKIAEAFWALGGVRGIMNVTGLKNSQAYVLAGKFGLIRASVAERNRSARARRQAENLQHLKTVWGWEPGNETATLKRGREIDFSRKLMAGNAKCLLGKKFLQYTLPTGKVREYMIAYGLKWWVAGDRKITVDSVKGRGTSLCLKLNP